MDTSAHQIDDLYLLQNQLHEQPHNFLGVHQIEDGKYVLRVWLPSHSSCTVIIKDQIFEMQKVHVDGLFIQEYPQQFSWKDYLILSEKGHKLVDPYAFCQSIDPQTIEKFHTQKCEHVHHFMGGRLIKHEGVYGARFLVWAPFAKGINIIGDFNEWNEKSHPMRKINQGIWELFIPSLKQYDMYQFCIHRKDGSKLNKADPFALYSEFRPKRASILYDLEAFTWSDDQWIKHRDDNHLYEKPFSIYEVHLGSWKRKDSGFFNYKEIAHELAAYVKDMGYTHVQLMPIAGHPLDESWGYQVSAYFSITSRFGVPHDFQYFVDHMHKENIGVIIDWVGAHFPIDLYALAQFDGSYLYEFDNEKYHIHPQWNTLIFDYRKREVKNFLLSNAYFWCEKFHVDAIRFDAVSSMILLDFERQDGQWASNQYGGNENLDAIDLIKEINQTIGEKCPGVITIAEESHAFPKVTHSVEDGGLGFHYKWGLGWMHDTFQFMSTSLEHRKEVVNALTFYFTYQLTEKFILSLSHDEVVHGKKSLLMKMPGDKWQQFACYRQLLALQMSFPGKQLLFMGAEFAMIDEWCESRQIHWHLLDEQLHQQFKHYVHDLNHLYLNHGSYWNLDFTEQGSQVINTAVSETLVLAYLRKCPSDTICCVHNLGGISHSKFFIHVPGLKQANALFNSDDKDFGGSGQMDELVVDKEGFWIQLPALCSMFIEVKF